MMGKHSILLPEGRVLSSGGRGPAIRRVTVTDRLPQGREKQSGAVCAVWVEIELMDSVRCPLNIGEEFVLYGQEGQLGVFRLEEAYSAGDGSWYLTAYDRVRLLDRDVTAWLSRLNRWPYRADVLLKMLCAQCGVPLKEEKWPEILLPRLEGAKGITGRQVMRQIARGLGGYVHATSEGEMTVDN